MSDYIIKVENLGKKYSIQHQGERERYVALRDVIARKAMAPLRWLRNQTSAFRSQKSASNNGNGANPHFAPSDGSSLLAPGSLFPANGSSPSDLGPLTSDVRPLATEDFWALRDVSFEVKQGEVVGIIGRNGAGKSTLLKILSRITEPTEGRVRIRGRVASLLEVGTGFHPELTGRENIFVNGAILGMTRAEIAKKFDEIVAFADIEKFLDTPVKRYSSGMYVRLAFAVAAHLEPEILIIDEVLAVGDVGFQRKCLGKMGDVAKQGRTVLFVSHQVAVVQTLCTRTAMLEGGRLVSQGPTRQVVRDYIAAMVNTEVTPLDARRDRRTDGTVRLTRIQIEDGDGRKLIGPNSALKITIHYKGERPLQGATFLVGIYDLSNTGIYAFKSNVSNGMADVLPAQGSVVCVTKPINLTPGRCYVNLAVQKGGGNLDYIQHAAEFDIEADDHSDAAKVPSRDWVLCFVDYEWFSGQ